MQNKENTTPTKLYGSWCAECGAMEKGPRKGIIRQSFIGINAQDVFDAARSHLLGYHGHSYAIILIHEIDITNPLSKLPSEEKEHCQSQI